MDGKHQSCVTLAGDSRSIDFGAPVFGHDKIDWGCRGAVCLALRNALNGLADLVRHKCFVRKCASPVRSRWTTGRERTAAALISSRKVQIPASGPDIRRTNDWHGPSTLCASAAAIPLIEIGSG